MILMDILHEHKRLVFAKCDSVYGATLGSNFLQFMLLEIVIWSNVPYMIHNQ